MKKIITITFLISIIFFPSLLKATEEFGIIETPEITTDDQMKEVILIGPPTYSPVAGEYHTNQTVSLNAGGSSAICYTLDGSDPTCSGSSDCSNGTEYVSGGIAINSTKTLKSVSCYSNGDSSSIASNTYTLTCSVSSVTNGTVSAYPGCAITCNSGYTLSGGACVGAGSGIVSGGGGGGGGGGSYTPPTNLDKTETYSSSNDGTTVRTETTSKKDTNGSIYEVEAVASINPGTTPTLAQTIKIDTKNTTLSKEVKVEIPSSIINNLISQYGAGKEIKVTITSGKADSEQKTDYARGGKFMIGYDIFSINIEIDNTQITEFSDLLKISFDVSAIYNKTNLKAYYYDEDSNKWEIAGDGGAISGNELILDINHLTDYALIRDNVELPTEETTTEGTTTETEGTTSEPEETLTAYQKQWLQVEDDAQVTYESGSNLNIILIHNNVKMDVEAQKNGMEKYIPELIEGINNLSTENKYAINNFIVYGTISTRILGAGERAGVVNSYKKAFNKLPATQSEWEDCIAIGNGRWPGERSVEAENKAKEEFKKVYLRDANMDNQNDNAAVTVMAYGLRPSNRNMDSEKVAINSFKHIYKYHPSSALDWDIVRAVSYSGATR
jgi:hypothetical protein